MNKMEETLHARGSGARDSFSRIPHEVASYLTEKDKLGSLPRHEDGKYSSDFILASRVGSWARVPRPPLPAMCKQAETNLFRLK